MQLLANVLDIAGLPEYHEVVHTGEDAQDLFVYLDVAIALQPSEASPRHVGGGVVSPIPRSAL